MCGRGHRMWRNRSALAELVVTRPSVGISAGGHCGRSCGHQVHECLPSAGVVIAPERGVAIQQSIRGYAVLGSGQLRWMNGRQWGDAPERVLQRSAQESTSDGAMDIQQSIGSTPGATSNGQNQEYAPKCVLWPSAKKSTPAVAVVIQQSIGGYAVLSGGQLRWMNRWQWGYTPERVLWLLVFGPGEYAGRDHGHTTINREYAGRGFEWAESGVNAQSCPLAFGVGECADHGRGNTPINWGYAVARRRPTEVDEWAELGYPPERVLRPLSQESTPAAAAAI